MPTILVSSLLTSGSVLALWVFIVCIFRITFHPAAKFPGPFLAKFTDFYGVYHAVKGYGHVELQKLHNKHGSIIRLGPNKIAFCSSTALHTIYTSRSVRKSQGYAAMDPIPGASNTHTAIDIDIHRAKRKAIGPAFTEQSLRQFEPNIWEQARVFENQLRSLNARDEIVSDWSDSINMAAVCRNFTLDTIGAFAFGKSFGLQSETRDRGIIDAMRAAMYVTDVVYNFPKLKAWGVPNWIKIKGGWTQQQWGTMSKILVENRLKRSVNAKADMFAFILGGKQETNDKIPMGDLWAEARLTLLAGTDTTSAALAAAFFYLSRYPDKLKKLEMEIRMTFSKVDDIRAGANLAQCKYLRAVVDESMRLSPPIAIPLWRQVMPEGLIVDGEHVAGGLDVGVSLHCLFKSANCFPDPFRFVPERWLDTENPYMKHLEEARHTFRPFSLGSRSCVGSNLAGLEVNILLARVLWAFEMRRPTGAEDGIGAGLFLDADNRITDLVEYQSTHHFTPETDGPFLQFRERSV